MSNLKGTYTKMKSAKLCVRKKSADVPSYPMRSIEYEKILDSIVDKIKAAQTRVTTALNRELIGVCWEIGETISEKQWAEELGDSFIERLARDLKTSFPMVEGLSENNLLNMRDLHKKYHQKDL